MRRDDLDYSIYRALQRRDQLAYDKAKRIEAEEAQRKVDRQRVWEEDRAAARERWGHG
jgi:hypothetical protein